MSGTAGWTLAPRVRCPGGSGSGDFGGDGVRAGSGVVPDVSLGPSKRENYRKNVFGRFQVRQRRLPRWSGCRPTGVARLLSQLGILGLFARVFVSVDCYKKVRGSKF